MTIKELKLLWEAEKQAYQSKEIGSGVQMFVKKVLQCPELFNLKEGKLSTEDNARSNEYLEEAAKKQKRADIVIFMNAEVVIPAEVERFGNIKIGEEQLFNYQLVWDKKNGILTDGNLWIFYISKVPIKSFTITEIFENPKDFLVFWNDYTQPLNYYINFFKSNIEEENLNIEKNRQNFFTDITTLISNFKDRLNIKGYFETQQKTDSEKQAIEISYAYLIQFILYKTLVDNNFTQFNNDFEQRKQRLLNNLQNQNFGDILTVTKAISNQISNNIYRPFKEEQDYINKKIELLVDKPKNELHEVIPWLDIFVFVQRYNFANIQNEIFGFIYENYLKQLYDEKLGQYFTSPEVTDFMLEQIGYFDAKLKKSIEKQQISIIDPSCGSGTFLYSAVRNIIDTFSTNTATESKKIEQLVTNNVFGIDVAEFPLYLAEMSIIMRMLPIIINEEYNNPIDKKLKIFKTKDTISEFLDTSIRNTISDTKVQLDKNKGQLSLFAETLNLEYDSFIRNKSDLEELKRSLENRNEPRIDRYRFDFVIGNPPYISYNECASQGVLFFQLIKDKLVNLNDVYGVNLHSVPGHPKKYRPNPNIYAFFIAAGLALLKDEGKLCYIIPQTLLTAGDLDVLRYHLAKFTTIEKIITFNNKMFIARGLKQDKEIVTSSLILIVRKLSPIKLHETTILHYENTSDTIENCLNNIRKGKNVLTNKVLQNNLLKQFRNWNFITKPKISIEIIEAYQATSESIEIYYEHNLAKHHFNSKFIFDSGYDIDDEEIMQEIPDAEYYCYPRLQKQFFTVKEFRGYFPNNRNSKKPHFIKLRQANQGYELLDSTFKVIWSYSNPQKFFFTKEKLIWPRNQICAIGSENSDELLYLFGLLNSSIIRFVLEAYLKSENEKNLQVSTSSIKEFVRVPILSEKKNIIKREIIRLSKEILVLEARKLSDFVDFSNVMMQKINSISIEDNFLIVRYLSNSIKCPIKQGFAAVKQFVLDKNITEEISLSNLKSAICIDSIQINQNFSTIENLVYALYFNILTDELKNIPAMCEKHKFYGYVFSK